MWRQTASYSRAERPFLTAEWRHLVVASWAIDPALLIGLVPAGTELDSWGGAVYLSIVAFQFRNTRVMGLPIPGHRNFEEINLRFYVRRAHPEGVRRGVVFLREIVPRGLIALAARRIYHEPYVCRSTQSRIAPATPSGPGELSYRWRHAGAWDGVDATTAGASRMPEPDSEEAFIAEHYWGYNTQPDGETMEYRVAHPPWRVWRASVRCELAGGSIFGRKFEGILQRPPDSGFVADGSPVTVYRGVRLTSSLR